MLAFGIDIGYSAVKTAVTDETDTILHTDYTLHKGNLHATIDRHLEKMTEIFGSANLGLGGVTGNGRHLLSGRIKAVNEVTALVQAGMAADREVRSVIEIGAQTAKYITGLKDTKGGGIKISMNANCSSGTGSFLEEQMSRLNLDLADYSALSARAGSIPRIAGRCSVFAKTDITHHQQEGVAVEDILLGLAYAVVRNFRVSVMKKLPMETPILLTGGVAYNQGIIRALKDVLDLAPGHLVIPEHFSTMGAVGAALVARKENLAADISSLANAPMASGSIETGSDTLISLPPLVSFGRDDNLGRHDISEPSGSGREFYLGIDVGSTSTNLVLCDPSDRIIDYRYLRTKGEPAAAVRQGLKELEAAHGKGKKLKLLNTCVTGSGRYLIAKMVGTDTVKDEITAQAKAAVTLDPEVDTIFEIGGQDSKFISIKDGQVADFQMNKVCAAGTGSFIEEQAKKFNIPVDRFAEVALNSTHPVDLGQRCTVFIETTLSSHLSQGTPVTDLAAGLCYAVVKNYLNRVVGRKTVGKKIFFQGGLGHNQGVVNAFRAILGKEIIIPPFFSVTGAYGAAVLAREAAEAKSGTSDTVQSGGRPVPAATSPAPDDFSRHVQEMIFQGHENTIDPEKKTVGLPRALFTFGMFSMFHAVFKTLGFNVVLSDPSNEEILGLAQTHSLDETCFPVKLVNGHVAQLVDKKVDYIFFPDLFTVNHPGSESRQNYGCAYMQVAFKIVSQAMDLEKAGITLLAPTIAFHRGPQFMAQSFTDMGKKIGKTKEETLSALKAGMGAFQEFENRLAANQEKVIAGLAPDEKVFVLVSKIYGVADPVLNLAIPDKLAQMGYKTIPFFDLPEGNIFKEHPNMYWPFAQHMLDPAYLIKAHPNLYAVLLTHHGCGPDSVVSHFFSEIMGSKPFLHIEVDEHASAVGVMTRVEAFVNSISAIPVQTAEPLSAYQSAIVHTPVSMHRRIRDLAPDTRLILPHLFPYSHIFKEVLARQGIAAAILPETTRPSLDRGRKETVTNEYYSLTGLLGDILTFLEGDGERPDHSTPAFFIPQTEGAEVDGQYSRFIRTKLDQAGYRHTPLVSPFLEDTVTGDPGQLHRIFMGLAAGDLIRLASPRHRQAHLEFVTSLIRRKGLALDDLVSLAQTIGKEIKTMGFNTRLLVTGDPLVLFNDLLTNHHFSKLESMGHQVVYTPLSEYMLMLWKDYAEQNGGNEREHLMARIDNLAAYTRMLEEALGRIGAFEPDLDRLSDLADRSLGLYAGTNGRYRMAKGSNTQKAFDGVITVSPMYENTGISLNILGQKLNGKTPVLNLTFDGNTNPSDTTRLEAFLFYSKTR